MFDQDEAGLVDRSSVVAEAKSLTGDDASFAPGHGRADGRDGDEGRDDEDLLAALAGTLDA